MTRKGKGLIPLAFEFASMAEKSKISTSRTKSVMTSAVPGLLSVIAVNRNLSASCPPVSTSALLPPFSVSLPLPPRNRRMGSGPWYRHDHHRDESALAAAAGSAAFSCCPAGTPPGDRGRLCRNGKL